MKVSKTVPTLRAPEFRTTPELQRAKLRRERGRERGRERERERERERPRAHAHAIDIRCAASSREAVECERFSSNMLRSEINTERRLSDRGHWYMLLLAES